MKMRGVQQDELQSAFVEMGLSLNLRMLHEVLPKITSQSIIIHTGCY